MLPRAAAVTVEDAGCLQQRQTASGPVVTWTQGHLRPYPQILACTFCQIMVFTGYTMLWIGEASIVCEKRPRERMGDGKPANLCRTRANPGVDQENMRTTKDISESK